MEEKLGKVGLKRSLAFWVLHTKLIAEKGFAIVEVSLVNGVSGRWHRNSIQLKNFGMSWPA
jgi:hypothetical protein